MTSTDSQSGLPQSGLDQATDEPYMITQGDHALAILSRIQAAAIANMDYLLATDTGRITAIRTVILGAALHAMVGLPSAAAQVYISASQWSAGADLELVRVPSVYIIRFLRVSSHHRFHHRRLPASLSHGRLAMAFGRRNAYQHRETKSNVDSVAENTLGLELLLGIGA